METVDLRESTEPLWFCLRTQPKHEKMAAQFLRAKIGLEVFSPVVRFQRVTMRGKVWFEEALFPCYIFARFPFSTHCRIVASAMGVTKIVGFGGQAAVVDDRVITELREFVRDNEVIEIAPVIAPGDEVTLMEGPFKGLRAVVTRVMPARERVAVLLDLLGTQREVEITADRVVAGKVHPLSERAASGT